METSKNKALITFCVVFITVLLTGFGCESQTSIVEPLNIVETEIFESHFNLQTESPLKVLEFNIAGDPTGDWTGNFPGPRVGQIEVDLLSSMIRGNTIHVVQTWMIVPPEPIFSSKPVVPPDPIEPVKISLKGILNLANGNVVLNGMSDELGVHVHVRGQLMTVGSGAFSIGGELMFNPQPEPPPSPAISEHFER